MNVLIAREGLTAKYAMAHLSVLQDTEKRASLTLFQNPHIAVGGKPTLLFGELQLPTDNTDATDLLMNEAEAEARRLGCQVLLGPMNGSTWNPYRIPLEGAEPLFAGDLSTPSTVTDYLQAANYRIVDTYRSSIATLEDTVQPSIPDNVSLRLISPDSLLQDLPALYTLCMSAFAGAPYFSPLDEAEFIEQYCKAAPLLAAGLSYTAVQGGHTIAFVFAYPDQGHNAIVIKTIARHPTTYVPGLMHAMLAVVCFNAYQLGYRKAIHAFMHDKNRSLRHSADFGGTLLRRYALLAKTIGI